MGVNTKMSIPAAFRPFLAAVKTAFRYLEFDYGFRIKSDRGLGSEAWVVYENQTTRISVHYELGAEPWVEIGRLELRDGQRVQPASIGLDLLLRERGKPLSDGVKVPRDIGEVEISQMVSIRAERLHDFGGDLLRGDFGAFPKLQTKAEQELQRREAELFGSKG